MFYISEHNMDNELVVFQFDDFIPQVLYDNKFKRDGYEEVCIPHAIVRLSWESTKADL